MSRKCEITGVGPLVGNNVSHSHHLSKRRWNVNLQKVRVLVDGQVVRMTVSTQAIRSGLIEKPPIVIRQKPAKAIKAQSAKKVVQDTVDEEPISQFFSTSSHVDRMFKRRKGAVNPFDEGESFENEGFGEGLDNASEAGGPSEE